MASGADGTIKIDTKIDEGGFNKGIASMSGSFKNLKSSFKDFSQMALGFGKGLVKNIVPSIKNMASSLFGTLKNVFKALSIGALVIFGVAFKEIFGMIRESMSTLINTNLKGSKLATDLEGVKNQFTELKSSVAAAFLPLVQFAIPYIKMALDWLIKFFNQVGMVTAAFLGQKEVVQVVSGSAATLAKNTEKAKKAAEGALAAFDQINVLQTPDTGAATDTQTSDLPQVMTQMVPVTDEIMNKVQAIKDIIAAWWNDPIGMLEKTWSGVVDWFKTNIADGINGLMDNLFPPGTEFRDKFLDPLSVGFYIFIESTKTLFKGLWAVITDDSMSIPEKIKAIWGLLSEWFKTNVTDAIGARLQEVMALIMSIFTALGNWIKTNIGIPLQTAFGTALDWVSEKFRAVFGGIVGFVRGVINSIIDIMNGMLSGMAGGLNGLISGINAVAGQVPGGVTISNVEAPKIPRLATGAVIPPNAQFAAVLGDQRSGKNIEAPESLIRQIVSEEIGRIQADITINFSGSLAGLVRELKPVIDKENVRVGGSLIKSGATI